MAHIYKISLMLTAQPEGGYTMTSPVLPELVTEGDTVEEAMAQGQDALVAVVELYEDLGKPLPGTILGDAESLTFEYPVTVA
jgi:antitoxin HicB